MKRRKLIAGNWKMNGLKAQLSEAENIKKQAKSADCDVLLAPAATLVGAMADLAGDDLLVAGQDCHAQESGAHTGDISAQMLADSGASYVILGHSERRADHGETDALVRDKTQAAWDAGLCAIVCVGETLDEREAANTLDIIGGQLASSIPDGATALNLVVAYEPVWAIGTGLTANTDQIGEVHDFIRARLERRFGEGVGRSLRILYGGSMKPSNAAEILSTSNVDGGLIGGASLKADDFNAIIDAAG